MAGNNTNDAEILLEERIAPEKVEMGYPFELFESQTKTHALSGLGACLPYSLHCAAFRRSNPAFKSEMRSSGSSSPA